MGESVLKLDHFLSWLCEHEREVVGSPGTLMHSPLALYLSEKLGHVYGVNGRRYGRMCRNECWWDCLPVWAQRFVVYTERHAFREMTGNVAFCVLVELESCYGALFLYAEDGVVCAGSR